MFRLTARLYRQVDVFAYIVIAGNRLYQLVGYVFGVGRGKTHAQIRRHLRHRGHQLGKGHIILFPKIGIDVLS